MQKKGLLSRLVFPLAAVLFFSGCYSVFEVPKNPKKELNYPLELLDFDCDGIPNIYDPHPYNYDFYWGLKIYSITPSFRNYYYYYPPYLHFPFPNKNSDKEAPSVFPKKERKKDTQELRNNGSR
ncbi:hypothetical protein J4411_02380 [Candidatus Pacearchaeota archaeon]|nr:hypothetical protein [Candidatus Pacearchaeota archaeon]